MMFDLAEVIGLCDRAFVLTRRPRLDMVNGRKRATDNPAQSNIRGSLQNPRERELQDLPEGQRADGIRSFYTSTRLYLGEVGDQYESDRITDPTTGRVFEAYAERDWKPDGNYYRYLVRKVGQ